VKWLFGIFLAVWVSASWAEWPKLPFPKKAKVEAVGENVRLNGVPMRMHRVLSKGNPEEMLRFYRDALGEDHAEVRVRQKNASGGYSYTKVLSQLKDGYFITVRVTRVASDVVETLLAVSDGRPSQSTRGLPLGFSLPSGSKVISDMESVDAGKNSRQLVFNNAHSMQANENLVIDLLRSKGYRLQANLTKHTDKGLTMMFVGDGREAMVVLSRLERKTSVVMTTISSLELAR